MNLWKCAFLLFGMLLLRQTSSAQIHQQWMTQTDSVSPGAIAVDRAGNVFVAGGIFHGTSGFDMVLVKYDETGVQQWMRDYNGAGDDADFPTAIAVDSGGNIFVTGYSLRGPTQLNFEIVTIKYSTAGDSLWVRHYNGANARDDRPFAITVDSAGNAYVAGYLNNPSLGNVYGEDYITIKYGPGGDELWASRYDLLSGAVTAIAVDPAGNVYVTGAGVDLSGSTSGVTIKYSASGALVWWTGTAAAVATGLVLDDSGYVYMSGYTSAASAFTNYVTMKYSGTGAEQWTRWYDGPVNEDDKARGLAVDKDYNVYVTGEASVVSGSYVRDFATIKYDREGTVVWTRLYDGTGGSVDVPVDMAIDSLGGIYITGKSIGPWEEGGGSDFATIKYSAAGDSLWVQRYNAANLEDAPAAMDIDRHGNVYVTGVSQTSYTSDGAATIKYSQAAIPAAQSSAKPPAGEGSTTSFGATGLTFIGDVTVSDSVSVFFYLEPPSPGSLPPGIIRLGDYYWRVVNGGTLFSNGFVRVGTEDLVGVTVGGCGACLVWLKRDNPGDPWQIIGGSFDGTLTVGTLISTIPFDGFSEFAIGSTDSTTLDVAEHLNPFTFRLAQNYPNPFNPSTIVEYTLPSSGFVTLKVYNVLGQEVALLVDQVQEAGAKRVSFDAAGLPSGIYLCRLTAGSRTAVEKLMLVK